MRFDILKHLGVDYDCDEQTDRHNRRYNSAVIWARSAKITSSRLYASQRTFIAIKINYRGSFGLHYRPFDRPGNSKTSGLF